MKGKGFAIDPGLCRSCLHARKVRNRRGSTFVLCLLFRGGAEYAKYPPLPVFRCDGYSPGEEAAEPPDFSDDSKDAMPSETSTMEST